MKTFFLTLAAAAALLSSASCSNNGSPRTVRVDEDFTALYMRDSCGVTEADGTISILLDDGSSLFMTGDCFTGKVTDGKIPDNSPMLHNSLIHIGADYTYLGSILGGTPDNPRTLCEPEEAATSEYPYWYWPGHGFQLGNTLFLYMSKFYQAEPGQWGFRYDGADLVRLDMDNYDILSISEVYDGSSKVHWGHCVMKDDGEYYVYGTRSGLGYDPAQLCVSRVAYSESAENPVSTVYFDGKGWTEDPEKAAACEGLDISVSEQFSVFRYDDKYVLLTQRRAQQAGDIWSYTADSPTGPWSNKKLLYETQEQKDPELFTYNAMAHPQFVNDDNELLICYNINSYNLQRPFYDVKSYRPVFLRIPIELILNE